MITKNTHIQIRCSKEQKDKLKAAANKAGLSLSAYILMKIK